MNYDFIGLRKIYPQKKRKSKGKQKVSIHYNSKTGVLESKETQ